MANKQERYILTINAEDKDLTLKLAMFFNSLNIEWSHPFSNVWLLINETDSIEYNGLKLKLYEILEAQEFLIAQITHRSWAARTVTNSNFTKWLREKFLTSTQQKNLLKSK